ncbi:MAG TPA: hypothetical protein VFA74_17075 [Terriglobales bacterium]|nr:hypothetical protein [Terriglobales bacterium]
MILLITPSTKSQECARALSEATTETVNVAATLREAAAQLRAAEYSAVIVDQYLMEAEPDESEIVLQHMDMAIPVYVNFAISGIERIVRELRAALHRRKKEALMARQGAEQALGNELKGTITALLLSCEMALQVADLPEKAEAKLRNACDLAREMRGKLGMAVGA